MKIKNIMFLYLILISFISHTAVASEASLNTEKLPEGLSSTEWSQIKRQINNPESITSTNFQQQAYIKASNTGDVDLFGHSIALSGDTLVVGAHGEDSNTFAIDGEETNNLASLSGAAFVFVRDVNDVWTKQAYLKSYNSETNDNFANSVSISGDTIVVGAWGEDSNSIVINSGKDDNSKVNSGAAYVFTRTGSTWTQQAYLKAANADENDRFGYSVAVSGDSIVVGARLEDSIATGVNNINSTDNSASNAGAAYVFTRTGSTWTQQAYLKAANTGAGDFFGTSVAISNDTIVVAASLEDSNGTGINSINGGNDLAANSGSAYVFVRTGSTWSTEAYLKASNTGAGDQFGTAVAIANDTIVVGAIGEDSNTTGVNGTQTNNSASFAGAAYIFARTSTTWSQQAYLKALSTEVFDFFGTSVAISGETIVVGALGDTSSTLAADAGAAIVFSRTAGIWSQDAYLQASNAEADDFLGTSVAISGNLIAAGADGEDSDSITINSGQSNNMSPDSGAAYIFDFVFSASVGGSVTGLANGSSVILQNNNSDDLTISANGPFAFSAQLSDLSSYAVTVLTDPSSPNQSCEVTGGNSGSNNGTGTIAGAPETSIVVTCITTQYTVGGTLSGLGAGRVTLQNNHSDDLTLSSNGPFSFDTSLNDLSNYSVSVLRHPTLPDQTCILTNERGTISGRKITDIIVFCNTAPATRIDRYTLLEDGRLVADDLDGSATATTNDNGVLANDTDAEGNALTVVSPGSYTAGGIGGILDIFADGRVIYTAPADISGQATFVFDVTDGLNTVASSLTIDVFAVNDAPSFSISGNVDGSSLTPPNTAMNVPGFANNIVFGPSDEQSSQAVLQFNVNVVADSSSVVNSVSVANNGQLNLDFTLNSGVATLQISLQDNGGTGGGGVDTSSVIEFTVSYSENAFSIGGILSGLGAGSVVLQNNDTDDLTLSANGAFVFATPLTDLSNYSVAVTSQPNSPTQTCQVTNPTGTLAGQDITSVLISCNTAPTSVADVYSLEEDGSLNNTDIDGTATATNSDNGVLANDSDVEGDTLTVVAPGTYTAAGIGGDINILADGSFTYSAPADLSGSATLDFEVTDGLHVIASTLTIEVFRINDAPSFSILGDVDATGLISSENNFAQIIGFAFDFIYGPEDEQLTQVVQQFNVNIVSDSNSILNAVFVANDGTLELDFTLNNGIAIIQISMRDDGGTSDGGIDTSAILEFTVMNTDMVFDNGFEPNIGIEGTGDLKVLDYLNDINARNQNINTINYNFNEDSIEFYAHSLKLNDDYNSSKIMQRVELWLTEVLIYEDATGDFDFDGLLNSDDTEPFIFKH